MKSECPGQQKKRGEIKKFGANVRLFWSLRYGVDPSSGLLVMLPMPRTARRHSRAKDCLVVQIGSCVEQLKWSAWEGERSRLETLEAAEAFDAVEAVEAGSGQRGAKRSWRSSASHLVVGTKETQAQTPQMLVACLAQMRRRLESSMLEGRGLELEMTISRKGYGIYRGRRVPRDVCTLRTNG